jgi:hypothetical protein
MKTLVIIPSCARDREGQHHQSNLLRGRIDYRFFLGVGHSSPAEDEVILPVRDDYVALPAKVRAAMQWALDHDYDYVFKCDRDTFIHGDRLAKAVPIGEDYVGLVGNEGDCAGGGAGYWVSRLAMITYLTGYSEHQVTLAGWQKCEDWCLKKVLYHNSTIRPLCDRRYWDLRLGSVPDPETNITWNPWNPLA